MRACAPILTALTIVLAGCGQAGPSIGSAAHTLAGPLAVRDALPDLASFLKGDATFQATGCQNAFKVASLNDHGFNIQMWYADLSGYFGNADTIEASFGSNDPGHGHFQSFTLNRLSQGFYQMNFVQSANDVHHPAVAFHVGDKWDSNLGRNYTFHYQPMPTHPW